MKTFIQEVAESMRANMVALHEAKEVKTHPIVPLMPKIAEELSKLTGEKWVEGYSGGIVIGYFRSVPDTKYARGEADRKGDPNFRRNAEMAARQRYDNGEREVESWYGNNLKITYVDDEIITVGYEDPKRIGKPLRLRKSDGYDPADIARKIKKSLV